MTPEEIKDRARLEISEAISRNPKLEAFQETIEDTLDRCPNPQSRMEVLAILIAGNIRDINNGLAEIGRILNAVSQ